VQPDASLGRERTVGGLVGCVRDEEAVLEGVEKVGLEV